jgi:hypothetical protein
VPKLLMDEHKMKQAKWHAYSGCCDASWQFPPTHCCRNARSHRDIWLGTIQSSPLQPRLSAKWFSCVPASENFPWIHIDEVIEAVNTWFALQVASFYNAGIQKLVPRYDKCLNNGWNYVKK